VIVALLRDSQRSFFCDVVGGNIDIMHICVNQQVTNVSAIAIGFSDQSRVLTPNNKKTDRNRI
jgi:hypothetical protein